jgi:hypothetical protein
MTHKQPFLVHFYDDASTTVEDPLGPYDPAIQSRIEVVPSTAGTRKTKSVKTKSTGGVINYNDYDEEWITRDD